MAAAEEVGGGAVTVLRPPGGEGEAREGLAVMVVML